jgi:hypothetical protein
MTTGTGTRTPTRRRPMMWYHWLGAGGLAALIYLVGLMTGHWLANDGRPTWHL